MARPKLTPEEKVAAKLLRQIQKEKDQQELQQRIEQENAQWESSRRSTFLELFYEFSILKQNIATKSERDYQFQRYIDNLFTLSFDTSGELISVGSTDNWYGNITHININTLTKDEVKQFKSSMKQIQEEITEYEEKCEREEKERIAKEQLKESALSKLSKEEKTALGLW